jgi:membrane associated rhomboid family serine protease
MKQAHPFGSTAEAIVYPFLLLALMWMSFWADKLFPDIQFYTYGVQPQTLASWKGIFLMPLIHSPSEIEHIINNSLPIAVLLGALIYYYREVALRVFALSWLMTGVGVWLFATNNFSYHIGMSGVIYALAGFLFTSGALRKYLPLQGISLFVVFVYGSMIWGIFPIQPHISWEGHLSGLLSGVALAFLFRKKGPQRPKYFYEIEREMGLEPPDFEAELNERIRRAKEHEAALEAERKAREERPTVINYIYIPKEKTEDKTEDQ